MRPIRLARTLAPALAAVAAALLTAGPAFAGYTSAVIVSGLNSPRGLAFAPDGALYVAESGFLSATGPEIFDRGQFFRLGATGSITRFAGGVQTRVVTGLASIASTTTGETTGPQDIAFAADGTGYVLTGFGANPNVRATDLAPGGTDLGRLYTFEDDGSFASVADVAGYEGANNPDGADVNGNPFHLAVIDGGLLATDAGANALLSIAADGTISLVATFPPRFIGAPFPSQSVPTGVAVGPDGAYYVAELTGFPFTEGAAQVYRIEPGEAPTVFGTGFTNIGDIAFGADGSLYVLELDSNGLATPGGGGALIRVGTDGTRSTIFDRGLVLPTGLEIGPDGAFYVTNFSPVPGIGQVLRISFVPEPATWAMLIIGFGAVGAALRRGRAAPQRRRGRAALAG